MQPGNNGSILAERTLANKEEQQSQIDRSKSKMTLAELCDRILENSSASETEND